MCTLGELTDFSLREVFQLLEKGHKTGLLTIYVLPESQSMLPPVYYIWVKQGRLVAAANRLDQQGLVELIEKGRWAGNHVLTILKQFCWLDKPDKPLGLCFKNQGLLNAEQLKQLFHIQVLQPVFVLCQLNNGLFKFEQNVSIPALEMTGLSVSLRDIRILLEVVHYVQQTVDQFQSKSKVLPPTGILGNGQWEEFLT